LPFLKNSPVADAAGWVDVHPDTLRHKKYNNIYALGDCAAAVPKTAAAIAAESGVVKFNLIAALEGRTLAEEAKYDGYTSCPLIVSRDKLVLAEFSGYTGQILETFPLDQRVERRSAQWLNKEIIPSLYWGSLLRGKWEGPGSFRKMMAPFKATVSN